MYKRDDILTPLASGKETIRSTSGAKDNTRPRMQPETNPGTHPGIHPDIHPGTRPSIHPDTNPGTRPSIPPDTNPGTRPSIHPDIHPDNQNDPRAEERYYSNSEIIIIEDLKEIPKFNKEFKLGMTALLLCEEGELSVVIDGIKYEVKKGSFIICSSLHTLSKSVISKDFRSFCLAFSTAKLGNIIGGNPEMLRQMLFVNDNPMVTISPGIYDLVSAYKKLFETKLSFVKHQYYNITIESLLKAVLFDIIGVVAIKMRNTPNNIESSTKSFSSRNAYVRRFLTLLTEDNFKHRTVQYFADQLCITAKYLSLICRQETGKTPNQWIKERLVERIRYLLLNTTLSNKEISIQLGFPNLSFFGKFTKEHLGYSPMEFRKRQ